MEFLSLQYQIQTSVAYFGNKPSQAQYSSEALSFLLLCLRMFHSQNLPTF
jgi:hypothetical protein